MEEKEWIIGYYNPVFEDDSGFEDCWQVYSDWNEMTQILRKHDVIKVKSPLSLFNVSVTDILSVEAKYSVVFDVGGLRSDNSSGKLSLTIMSAYNNLLKENCQGMINLLQDYIQQNVVA